MDFGVHSTRQSRQIPSRTALNFTWGRRCGYCLSRNQAPNGKCQLRGLLASTRRGKGGRRRASRWSGAATGPACGDSRDGDKVSTFLKTVTQRMVQSSSLVGSFLSEDASKQVCGGARWPLVRCVTPQQDLTRLFVCYPGAGVQERARGKMRPALVSDRCRFHAER